MNKIPFDIKYRPEIEAGKYEVVTRLDNPVKILCYDARGKYPIAGLVRSEETDFPQSWCIDGSFDGRNESINDLFLITPEPELSEFEQKLSDVVGYAISLSVTEPQKPTSEFVKEYAAELFELAKKELCESGKVTDYYAKGKAEALKDLPRWKKCAPCDEDKATIPAWIVRFDAELAGESAVVHHGHYILFRELEKLPKEDKK